MSSHLQDYEEQFPNGISVFEFRSFVGASDKKTDDELARVLVLAHLLVLRFIGSRIGKVPVPVVNEAVLQVAQALYFRAKEADNGRQNQYATDGEYLQTLPALPVLECMQCSGEVAAVQ